MKKAVFFDIDGTLCKIGSKVPESTKKAIQKLRENGIYVFVCTGRSRVMIPNDPILDLGFDGIIGSCGMHGEWKGDIIFQEELTKEQFEHTIEEVKKFDAEAVFEGHDTIYYSKEKREARGKNWIEELVEKMIPEHFKAIEDGVEGVCKWCVFVEEDKADALFAHFEKDYEIHRHDKCTGELVKKGCSKGNGIEQMCEHLGIDIKNTYAFGDSANDLEMLKKCGVGIAMGNASDDAKAQADYITDDIDHDGIYHACVHFNLI